MYICIYFTIFMQDSGENWRIFISVFIAYTTFEPHILSLQQYHWKELFYGDTGEHTA